MEFLLVQDTGSCKSAEVLRLPSFFILVSTSALLLLYSIKQNESNWIGSNCHYYYQFYCLHFRCKCTSCHVFFMTITKTSMIILRWMKSLRHSMLHRGFLPSSHHSFQLALLHEYLVCHTTC